MREYVRHQTAILLRRLAYQMNRAAGNPDEETVHDLRVAIRRLSRCLRVFAGFYPGHAWKRVRHRLHALIKASAEVRDCDIALELMTQAKVAPGGAAFKRIEAQRHAAAADLTSELRDLKQKNFSSKWRSHLGLSA